MSFDENIVLDGLINKRLNGMLATGSTFWGTLVSFNDRTLFLQGDDGRRLLIRRKDISQLMEMI